MFKIIEKLLYEEEIPGTPTAIYNRRWRWWLTYTTWRLNTSNGSRWGFLFGFERQLIQFEGKPVVPPLPVQGLYMQVRPFEWRLGADHIYYDGPHCLYMLGPFWLTNEFNSTCKECAIDV